jgi:hypothetical protein
MIQKPSTDKSLTSLVLIWLQRSLLLRAICVLAPSSVLNKRVGGSSLNVGVALDCWGRGWFLFVFSSIFYGWASGTLVQSLHSSVVVASAQQGGSTFTPDFNTIISTPDLQHQKPATMTGPPDLVVSIDFGMTCTFPQPAPPKPLYPLTFPQAPASHTATWLLAPTPYGTSNAGPDVPTQTRTKCPHY